MKDTAEAHGRPTDPYRIFFPLGVLLGIAGVSIWIVYYVGLSSSYSGRSHAFVQISGFLYSFIAGFLLTAVPRLTGTEAPSRPTQYVLALLIVGSAIAFEVRSFAWGHGLFLMAHVMLIALVAQRFRRRRQPPPDTFSFVGAGLLAGAIGAIVNAGVAWEWIAPGWDPLGKHMMTEGMVLLLVLGIGGFLGPRLLGFAALPDFQAIGRLSPQGRPPIAVRYKILLNSGAAAALVVSLVLEYGWGIGPAAFLRAGIGTAVIFATIRPWKFPATRTTLAWCVWTSQWFLVAGLWLVAAMPRYRADFLHVIFMGAFTLMILAIGMRVTLSHGGYALSQEKRSWPLRAGIITGLIAMLARLGAPFAPYSYYEHLALAAVLWIAGIAFWGFRLAKWIRGAHSLS